MKRFFQQCSVLFLVVISSLLVLVLTLIFCRFYLFRQQKGDMYLWGDSQMVYGLDLDLINRSSNFTPLSSANGGGGVYDFLIFANSVQDSSLCIVSFSECCLLRPKRSDYNRSGLDLKTLSVLKRNGYTIDELLTIWNVNRHHFSPKIVRTSSFLYDYVDTIVYSEPLSGFESMYASKSICLEQKIQSYHVGLKWLSEKGCSVVLVSFPFYNPVAVFSSNSIHRDEIDSEINAISRDFNIPTIDTLYVNDKDSLLMHDLSHLNAVGARRVTKELINYLDTVDLDKWHFVSINGGSCN